MFKKLKNIAIVLTLASALSVPVFAVKSSVYAVDIRDNLCSGAEVNAPNTRSGCVNAKTSSSSVQTAATNIINLFSWVVGIISVIMIIVAGFRYITSGGASEKVTGAKNTLIYAVIGLVIVALAQFIVNFVLKQTIDATS